MPRRDTLSNNMKGMRLVVCFVTWFCCCASILWSTQVDANQIDNGRDSGTVGSDSVISGGFENTAVGDFAVCVGGENNSAMDDHATVAGGEDNTAKMKWSSVLGGESNSATKE